MEVEELDAIELTRKRKRDETLDEDDDNGDNDLDNNYESIVVELFTELVNNWLDRNGYRKLLSILQLQNKKLLAVTSKDVVETQEPRKGCLIKTKK